MVPGTVFGPHAVGLAVALGCGLLIGLDRERRKGQGDDRRAAGLRSFTVASISGAMAQAVGEPGLVAVGGLLVVLLSAVAYFKSRSRDPGLTSELALFTTYLVGVTAVGSPPLGAACGAALAGLLAARERLHRFATQVLSEQELHDGLLLAGLGLVVLPLIPTGPLPWLGGIHPRPLAAMVLLILLLQAAGHVALRLLGPGRGLALSGFFSGFVSSTATIASMGSRVAPRGAGDVAHVPTRVLASAAVFSTAATWVQILAMAAVLSPAAARTLAPPALAALASAAGIGLALLVAHRRDAPDAARGERDAASGDALRVREALTIAVLLAVVTLGVTWAQQQFGQAGVVVGSTIAGLADAQSPVASLSALFAAGRLAPHELVHAVLAAVTSNSLMRVVVACTAGGRAFGGVVGAALTTGLALAWTIAVVTS